MSHQSPSSHSTAEHLDYLEQVAEGVQQRRSASRQQHEDPNAAGHSPTPSSALSSDFGSKQAHQGNNNPVSSVVEAYNDRQQYNFNEKKVQRAAAAATRPNAGAADSSVASTTPGAKDQGAAHRRLAAWSQMREETMQKLREEKDRIDAANMPFQPHVHRAPNHGSPTPPNHNSRSASASAAAAAYTNSTPNHHHPPSGNALSATVLQTHNARGMPAVQDRLSAMQDVVDENLRNLRDVKYKDSELTFRPEVHYHPVHDHQPSVVSRTTDSQRQRVEAINNTSGHNHHQSSQHHSESGGAVAPSAGGVSPRSFSASRMTGGGGDQHLSRVEREELMECTFQPAIGPRSRHVYETSRLDEGKMDVYTRLYSRSSAAAKSRSAIMNSNSLLSNNTSLQQQQQQKKQKQQMPPLPEELQDELDVLRAHCNLQNDRKDSFGTFLCNVLGAKSANSLPQPVDTPHYLCRLTEETMSDDEAEPAGDAATATSTANNTSAPTASARGGAGGSRSSSQAAGSTTVTIDFDEFLARQSEKERQRHDNRSALEAEYAPPLQPTICRESSRIVERKRERTLLQTSGDKENPAATTTKRKSSYEEPTFKPVISAVAEQFPRRGTERMHRYHKQYQTHIDELRDKKEQQESAETTFKPQTNKNYKHVDSMLNAKNLKAYKDHLAKSREQASQKKLTADAVEENEMHQQCTFRPKINRTPSYVANMAHSFSVVRDAQLELTTSYGQQLQQSPRWVN